MRTISCALFASLAALNIEPGRPWASSRAASDCRRSRAILHMAPAAEDSASSDERERMKTIRALQETFYSSPDDDDAFSVDSSSLSSPSKILSDGTIKSLPLWRVSWTELPGRSNVLIVHEARYTHMFEQIIRGAEQQQEQMYFGHLRLPGGSNSIGKEGYELNSWKKEAEFLSSSDGNSNEEYCYTDDIDTEQHSSCRSAVIGTLMRIVDYRRMGDGKMLLLVQAIDRFVLTNPIRELPFSVADVQLLPDSEEIEYHTSEDEKSFASDKNRWYAVLEDKKAIRLRSLAAKESTKWIEYELDSTVRLPVRDDGKDDLSPADVVGTALKGLIPHVPFSSAVTPSSINRSEYHTEINEAILVRGDHITDPLFEKQLVDSGILLGPTEPDPKRRRSFYSAEELEYELWIFVNEFVQIRNAVSTFPPELLALLPRNVDWPEGFTLEDLAATMAATSELEGSRPFVRVAEDYPAHRRRRRLSYVISALTDHTPFGRGMPPILLEIHSTRDRLEAVLDVFDFVNTEYMGEFS